MFPRAHGRYGGGRGKGRKYTSGGYSTVFVSNRNVISAFGHAIITIFFEPTFEQCLVLYFSLHQWPSLRYYPAPSTIRSYVGLAKKRPTI